MCDYFLPSPSDFLHDRMEKSAKRSIVIESILIFCTQYYLFGKSILALFDCLQLADMEQIAGDGVEREGERSLRNFIISTTQQALTSQNCSFFILIFSQISIFCTFVGLINDNL